MDLITLDFETYFDKEYSLKKLTLEEYIRNPKFKIHCIGIKKNAELTRIYKTLPEISWSNTGILCHNAVFDLFILNHWFGIRPLFALDTLSMARGVYPHRASYSLDSLVKDLLPSEEPKNVPYERFQGKKELDEDTWDALISGCKHDVDLTYELFKFLSDKVSLEELKVIDLTIKMATEPVLEFDIPRAKAFLEKVRDDKCQLLEKAC